MCLYDARCSIPHRTTHQWNKHVWSREVTKLRPNTLFIHYMDAYAHVGCYAQNAHPRVPNSVACCRPKNKSKRKRSGKPSMQIVIVTTFGKRRLRLLFSKWRPTFSQQTRLFTGLLGHWRSLRSSHSTCTQTHDNGTIQKESDTRPIKLCISPTAYWKPIYIYIYISFFYITLDACHDNQKFKKVLWLHGK